MVAKPLSERLDKPAVHKASSFEGHARAGVTGARIRQPNVAGAADVSAASPELASVARGAWTVPIRLPTAEVPVPSSYVRGVFSGPWPVRGREGASGPDLDGAVNANGALRQVRGMLLPLPAAAPCPPAPPS